MNSSDKVPVPPAQPKTLMPVRGLAPSSPALALVAAPAWLRSEVSDNGLSVCLFDCGVGDELEAVGGSFRGAALWGADASEEMVVEARRRHPTFRFRVADDQPPDQWDVVVRLAAPPAPVRFTATMERLATFARRAVVATVLESELALLDLPVMLAQRFVLAACQTGTDDKRWLVITWALPETPAFRQLTLGEVLPGLTAGGPALSQSAQALERAQTEVTQLRARVLAAQREAAVTRELLAEKQAELEHLAHEVDGLREQDAELRQELADMQTSRSWQLTRPMRQLVGRARKAKENGRDLLALAQRVSRDVAQGRAREWVKFATQRDTERQRTDPVRPRAAIVAQSPAEPLFEPTVFVFALVPFDDVGGGQRSAQLARVMAARGYRVVYVYLYKKWNVVLGAEEDSEVDVPLLSHLNINEVEPTTLLRAAPGSLAIFEVPHPRFEPFFQRAQQIGLRTVFELIDAWDTSLGGDWFKPEVMRRFVTQADLAVGTARVLVRDLERAGRRDALYLPNAGNEAIFQLERTFPRPPEIDPSRRCFVYVGSLYGEWFGWEHVRAAARLCSDSIFYLIGDPPKGVEVPQNVRFLGPRKIDEVPSYLACADAALLPFIPGKISEAVSPIKIFEYLMMGKRVISTDLPEVRDYPNTTITDSPDAFARACRSLEAPEDSPERFIMRNTWASRCDALIGSPASASLAVVVLGQGALFESERCLESLSLHGRALVSELVYVTPEEHSTRVEALKRYWPGLRVVVADARTIADGWAAVRDHLSTDVVLFIDERWWFTSRAGLEEAVAILDSDASLGMVGAKGRFLDIDSGRAEDVSSAWLNEQRGGPGYRREVAYLGARGLFVRRRLLDGVTATPLDQGELEGAELSFRVRAMGLDLAARALTGLRGGERDLPVLPLEARDAFFGRWSKSRLFFVTRRGI
jgi:glycosyltransferase involved in cell wall biosynthesis